MDQILNSSAEQINILVVIDTDYIKSVYPQQTNPDPNNPQGIDHNSQYMICYDPRGGIQNQGTADLQFTALPGDYVSFYGQSIYGNSDDAVILYGINYWNGDKVFNNFNTNFITRRAAVVPNPNSVNGIPAVNQSITFSNFTAQVSNTGTENFYVYIALYTMASDGNTQQLYGYFYWDPSIVVL